MGLLIKIVLMAFLVGALQQMPYGYYQLTKAILFIGCTVLAYQALKAKQPMYVVIFGTIAIVFLPLIEYGFKRPEWQLIDKITLGILFLSACIEAVLKNHVKVKQGLSDKH